MADGVNEPPTGLHEFPVSLHVGQEVVATYQATVLFPDQRMVDAMHVDRADEALSILATQSTTDSGSLLALLNSDGTFSDQPAITPAAPEGQPSAGPAPNRPSSHRPKRRATPCHPSGSTPISTALPCWPAR